MSLTGQSVAFVNVSVERFFASLCSQPFIIALAITISLTKEKPSNLLPNIFNEKKPDHRLITVFLYFLINRLEIRRYYSRDPLLSEFMATIILSSNNLFLRYRC